MTAPEYPTAPETRAGAQIRVPLRVLIVEDSEDDALLLLRELRRGGYQPTHERVDTPQAMQRALSRQEPWDMVISDYRMPHFRAPEALAMLRESGSEAPFVVVSGRIGEDAAIEVVKAGAYDYVVKDNLARLCPTIERALEEAASRRERERTERELRENQRRFRSLVLNSSDLISVLTPDGTRRYVSPSVERILGYAPEEITGGNTAELVHPEDLPTVMQALAQSARTTGTGPAFEYRMRHANGSWRVFETIATNLLPDPSVSGIVLNARDITERKRAEGELRRSRREYEDLVNSIDGIVWEADAQSVRFSFVSEQAERLLGYPTALWLSEPAFWQNHIHPDDRESVLTFCATATAQKRDHEFEYRMIAADGRAVWLRDIVTVLVENNEPVKLRGVMVDITKRKRSEAELREKEEQYRGVFESTSDGLIVNDPRTGIIVEANPAACRMHGYSREEFIGLDPRAHIHHDYHDRLADYLREVSAGGEFQTQAVDIRKDGTPFDVEVRGTTFTYKGKPHVLGVVRDVTERARSRRLLEQRVASLTRIAASLAVEEPMETTLRSLAASVVEASSGEACSVVLIDERTYKPRLAGLHGLPEAFAKAIEDSWRLGAQSPILRTFHEQRPQLLRDARRLLLDDPLYAPAHPFIREMPWDSVLVVPMVYAGRALGAISVHYRSEIEPEDDEVTFLGAVADQTAVAVENARLFSDARGKAALEERQRLARELHDSVSQALYGIALGTKTARMLLDRDPARVAEPLDYVLSLSEAGLAEMRALIFELRPESLESEGLVAALEKQAAALRARHEIPVRAILCDEPAAASEVKEALYRIAQEALHNAVKHARAGKLELRVECAESWIFVEVSDDGVGFDPEGSFPGHLGLHSMRERAASLRGILEVQSAPGRGSVIRATVPLAK